MFPFLPSKASLTGTGRSSCLVVSCGNSSTLQEHFWCTANRKCWTHENTWPMFSCLHYFWSLDGIYGIADGKQVYLKACVHHFQPFPNFLSICLKILAPSAEKSKNAGENGSNSETSICSPPLERGRFSYQV